MNFEEAIEMSIKNIAKHGDTDVFPFPIEKHIFHDNRDQCKKLLMDMHKDFDNYLAKYPPITLETLTQVGYTGFRWATQVEPFWNAYYLSLVISLAEKIEQQRIPIGKESVFSYRYEWNEDDSKLFRDSTWSSYKKKSLELCKDYEYVVVTDISDFYPRIYHHRLENALNRLSDAGDIPKRLMKLLTSFSKNVSYGLPVGGPASRILSELSLDSTDKLLARKKSTFCRYADDYSIFCNDKAEAYRLLVKLSESLYNEGLVLQKKKTKVITTEEFINSARLLGSGEPGETDDKIAKEEQKLLNISLRYDPYSETADEDYESLKSAIKDVDIIGILGREVSKSTIDPTVTKQAIKAIRALDTTSQYGAVSTLLSGDNLVVLSPVFVTVMKAVRGTYDAMPEHGKRHIDSKLVEIYEEDSHILSVDLNLSFYIQALARRQSQRKEEILIEIYESKTNPLLKRQIIIAMANWGCHYWLTDIKRQYAGLSEWEKRYFIGASYVLGDEGKHWRKHTKDTWSPMDHIVRDWFSSRNDNKSPVPL